MAALVVPPHAAGSGAPSSLRGWSWAGWAIVARRYTQDPLHLRYEAEARAERRGVWADPRFIPPDEWRGGRRR
jgi:hypothetical protein